MLIGPKMATLQEKKPKMDPKKGFFAKIPQGFLAFETSSCILTSNRSFWPAPIYRDINFVLKCLPEPFAEDDDDDGEDDNNAGEDDDKHLEEGPGP